MPNILSSLIYLDFHTHLISVLSDLLGLHPTRLTSNPPRPIRAFINMLSARSFMIYLDFIHLTLSVWFYITYLDFISCQFPVKLSITKYLILYNPLGLFYLLSIRSIITYLTFHLTHFHRNLYSSWSKIDCINNLLLQHSQSMIDLSLITLDQYSFSWEISLDYCLNVKTQLKLNSSLVNLD